MNVAQKIDACTGCGVCAAVCPSAAVKMQPDAHGFLRPVVDDAACTDCGLCTGKCPVSVLPQTSAHTDILTGYAKDGTLLPRSSSGAIFPVLAAEIIRRGGLVLARPLTRALMWYILLPKVWRSFLRFAAPSMSKTAFRATAMRRSRRRWPPVAGSISAECRARSQR